MTLLKIVWVQIGTSQKNETGLAEWSCRHSMLVASFLFASPVCPTWPAEIFAVTGCSNGRSKRPELLFLRFPTDHALRKKWIQATGREVGPSFTKTGHTVGAVRISNQNFIFLPYHWVTLQPLEKDTVPSVFFSSAINLCVLIFTRRSPCCRCCSQSETWGRKE